MLRNTIVLVAMALLTISCGGNKGGISKDTKADFQMTNAALKELGNKEEAEIAPYDDKIAEVKGVLRKHKESRGGAAPGKYVFFLYDAGADANDEYANYTICYSDTDYAASEGKSVTVKGKMSNAGVITLDGCVVY